MSVPPPRPAALVVREPQTAVAVDATTELVAAMDARGAVDPVALADGETIKALHRQLERLGAVVTRATAAVDAGRAWEDEGARSASAWIAMRCGQPVAAARRRVQLGRALGTCRAGGGRAGR